MDLFKDEIQRLSNRPFRIVQLHLAKIADVTNVIAFSVLVHILIHHRLPGNGLYNIERLQNGTAVLSSAAEPRGRRLGG